MKEITTQFHNIAERKLQTLLNEGCEINGVSIRRIHENGTVERGAVTDGGMVLWWRNPQQSTGICKHCQTPMRPGIAMAQTYTASEHDFPNDHNDPNAIVTMSPGGPGKLIDCLKCPQCGWSVK